MTLREMQRMIADLQAEVTRLKRSLDVQPVRTGRVQGGDPVTHQHYTIVENSTDHVTAHKGHTICGDLNTETLYYIAKPWILRDLESRGDVAYTSYTSAQTRVGTIEGTDQETQIMVPIFLEDDMVRAVRVSKTGVFKPGTEEELTLELTNASGRYWGEKHVG